MGELFSCLCCRSTRVQDVLQAPAADTCDIAQDNEVVPLQADTETTNQPQTSQTTREGTPGDIIKYHGEYSELLNRNRRRLVETINLPNLWSHLRSRNIVDRQTQSRIQVHLKVYFLVCCFTNDMWPYIETIKYYKGGHPRSSIQPAPFSY